MRVLALSGGGFRATLFHLGVIRRLSEENRLKDFDVICSVSGGSILAAHLILNWDLYTSPDCFSKAAKSVIDFVRTDVRGRVFRKWFCRRFGILLIPFGVLCWTFVFPLYWWYMFTATIFLFGITLAVGWWWMCEKWSRVNLLIKEYDLGLFSPEETSSKRRSYRLEDLRPSGSFRPKLFILATNLNTGDLCAFSHDGFHWWNDDKRSHIRCGVGSITVADAVAASSAFPPAFPPFRLLRDRVGKTAAEFPPVILLSDGGVYDNSGLQGLFKYRDIAEDEQSTQPEIIVSSAERAFDHVDENMWSFKLLPYRAFRSSDIVMQRVSDHQVEELKYRKLTAINFRLCEALPENNMAADVQLKVRNLRTDLNCFTMAEIQLIVYYGYLSAHKIFEFENRKSESDSSPRCSSNAPVIMIKKVLPGSKAEQRGLKEGMTVTMVSDRQTNDQKQANGKAALPELQHMSLSGGVLHVQSPDGSGLDVMLEEADLRIELTDDGMPYVPTSANTVRWLPFSGGTDVYSIKPTEALKHSESTKLFSAVVWPLMLWIFVAALIAASALAYLSHYSVPSDLSFESVFPETAVQPFEKQLLDEVNRDEILSTYKRSLVPDQQFPARRLFFAYSKPLSEYVSGRVPKGFECRVTHAGKEGNMKVRLFLRSETKGSPVYQILPFSSTDSLFQFRVPPSNVGDRIVAIGRIDGSDQDRTKISADIRLEVVE